VPAQLLKELEGLLRRSDRRTRDDRELIIASARARALGLARIVDGSPDAGRLMGIAFCGDVLSGLWLERPLKPAELKGLVEQIARVLAIDPNVALVSLYLRALREQHLLTLPPSLAIENQLGMLAAFAELDDASVWVADSASRPLLVVHVGDGEPSRRARLAARAALRGEPDASTRARLHAVPVLRWQRPVAAIVVRVSAHRRWDVMPLVSEAAVAMGPLFELDSLLQRSAVRERSLVEASERQLVRLGFDIHDGALQDLAALASEVRFFRSQLSELLEGTDHRDLVLGRVGDVEARVVAVDGELRELTHSIESGAGLLDPLPDVVRALATRFERASGAHVQLNVRGDLAQLTNSQAIALTRVVEEALENAREHSGARNVELTLQGTRGVLEATIIDDGAGFDVERRLAEAAGAGRLGLVGMAERVRLLGGRFEVDSSVGGPTRINARIPRWSPLDGAT
jgi:signal transduction histidine kinase